MKADFHFVVINIKVCVSFEENLLGSRQMTITFQRSEEVQSVLSIYQYIVPYFELI